MKRALFCILLTLTMILLLAGCGSCEHEWQDADCTEAKTCTKCGETQGAPLGHSWKAATCTAPKTCENCNATDGTEIGHDWLDATCIIPKKCALCHETQGDPIGHDWQEATTEAPKTCANCQTTEGSKLKTDPRFTTESTKALHGRWSCETVFNGEEEGLEEYFGELACTMYIEFGNTGDMVMSLDFHDRLTFMDSFTKMTIDMTYEALISEGLTKAQAQQAFQEYYGTTIEEYVNAEINSMSLEEIFGQFTVEGVYYVGNNGIYASDSWYDEFECAEYTLEDGVLTIDEEGFYNGDELLHFTKVEE